MSLGLGHNVISVRPILVIPKQRVGQANLVGPIRSSRLDRNITKGKQRVCITISVEPIAHLGLTETLRRETKRLQSHLDETEIPISETKKTRVYGCGYVNRTRWCRIERIDGAEFDFCFGTYVDVRKWLRALEHITKHFEQASH